MLGSGSSFGVPYRDTSSKWTCNGEGGFESGIEGRLVFGLGMMGPNSTTFDFDISLKDSVNSNASSSSAVTKESVHVLSTDTRRSLSF